MFFCFRFFSWFRSWLWFFWFLWCWRNRCTYALGQIIERLLCHIPNTKDHVCHIRILFVPSLMHQSVHCLWTNQIWVDNALVKLTTSSNQRLWECVRCRINVYPDTLNDFPSWLSTSKNQPFFTNKRGFTERYFSNKVHASLIDWWLRCVTAPVSRLTCLIGPKHLHQLFKFRAKYYHIDL